MHSGIGPAGRMSHRSVTEKTFQNLLEFGLYRAPSRLSLPADKAGAVVVEFGEKGPAHRARNLAVLQTSGKLRKCLSYLTKGALSGYNFSHPPPCRATLVAWLTGS